MSGEIKLARRIEKGQNTGDHKTAYLVVPGGVEEAAFEKLGPMTRRSLNECPLKVSSYATLAQIEKVGLDPKDPRIDRAVAYGIMEEARKAILLDRSEADALSGVTPLRATQKLRRRR